MQLQPEFQQGARPAGAVRILLVEDDPAFAGLVCDSLTRASSAELHIDHSETLSDALARLARDAYDLVLTDLDLPDSKGVDTLEALVGGGDRLICVLTGQADPALREAAIRLGAYDLVSKDHMQSDQLDRLVRLAVMQAAALGSVRRSEARLRAIVEAEPECVKLLDRECRLIEMNPAGLRMIEADGPDQVRGRSVLGIVTPEHREAFAQATRKAAEGQAAHLEFEIVGLKGARRWLETHVVPLHGDSAGEPLVLGITRDVTPRRRAEEERERYERTFQALSEANQAILRATTEAEVFDRACAIAVEAGGFMLGTILRLDADGGLTRVAAKGTAARYPEPHRPSVDASKPEGRGLIGLACRTGKPVVSNEYRVDARASGARSGLQYECGSVAVFPFFAERRLAGTFGLRHIRPGAFTPELVGLFERVAENISFALTAIRREAARSEAERLRGLEHAVAHELTAARSVPEALQAVLRAIGETVGFECGRYFHLDEAENAMVFREGWANDPEMARFLEGSRELRFEPGSGLVGLVWQSGEILWSADAANDPRVAMKDLARRLGVHGTLVVPVTFEGRVIGVLSVSTRQRTEPDPRLVQTLRVAGTQIGHYLQRKHAEQALADSELRFRETFELAASGIAHVGLDGRFLRVNPRLCRILGYAEGELVGRSVRELSHPDDAHVGGDAIRRLQAGETQNAQFEKRYVRKDGSAVWVSVNVAMMRDAAGAPRFDIAVYEDITERKSREAVLARFRAALDGSADMVLLFDMREVRLIDFNDTACYYLGYERGELLGMRGSGILVGVSDEALRASLGKLLEREDRTDLTVRTYRRKDGSTFDVEVLRRVVDSPQGPILVLNARDLTERRRIEERQAAHLRYQESTALLAQSALGRHEPAGLVEDALQTLKDGLDCERVVYEERLDEGWRDGYASALMERVQGDEGERGVLCALARERDAFGPEEARFLSATAAVLSAGLSRIDSEQRLAFLAQFDPLTGLPNRALLRDRFTQLIVQARRHGSALGLLFVDLDDFKLVNDTMGHAAGDELLKEMARRLLEAVRPGDTVARISGDEFAVILGDLAKPEDAALVAQKVIERLAAPTGVAGKEVFVGASIGIAAFPADGDDADALLAAADAAMYRAKQSGRNGYQFFTADINQRTRARAQLGAELRRALERDEFEVYYQAKFDLRSGVPCAVEALLRWRHPERGLVSPDEFIPVLEETGLIVAVGEKVLRRACADLRAWEAAGLRAIPVAVNLSARQFRQQDLNARILALVGESGVDPDMIELEITESQLMLDPEHAERVLRALADAGIRVAIDDFGTGYSSLSYLTRFPVAALKVDRSFVADVLGDPADAAIVRAIIDMAHTLGFVVVAEGVETQAQAAFLRSLGCEHAQGYFFARPMPEADFRALISPATPSVPGKSRRASRYQ
jgi:diguanylate cyclase (GGDEF)-like protein/PAS domain S-box-containing protein